MIRILAFILGLCSVAQAQTLSNLPPNTVVGRLGAGVAGPAQAIPFANFASGIAGVGLLGIQQYALGPGTISILTGGSGYAVRDTVTLACNGVSFSTSPIIAITAVSGGAVTGSSVINPGVATSVPANSCTFTQADTSGSGNGATWSGNFGPVAATLSFATLSTGGGASNGNLFLGAQTPSATLGTNENTFVGTAAGGNFTGTAASNTAFGLFACGIGGSAATGSFNLCAGRNAGRNISGAASRNTLVGDSAGGNETPNNLTGSDNVILGSGGQSLTSGNDNVLVGNIAGGGIISGAGNTIIGHLAGGGVTASFNTIVGFDAGGNSTGQNTLFGSSAGSSITSGSNNTVVGPNVASTTLSTGGGNVLIGTGSSCDTAGSSDINTLTICAGAGTLIHTTGGGTPSTSATNFAGNVSITGQLTSTTGTPTIGSGACGSSSNGAVVSGSTNQSGQITIGAAATTTCTISWSGTLAAAPNACVFFPMNATAAATGTTVARVGAPSTSSVVLSGSALANANYAYVCL